jgi:hypothetical protein
MSAPTKRDRQMAVDLFWVLRDTSLSDEDQVYLISRTIADAREEGMEWKVDTRAPGIRG